MIRFIVLAVLSFGPVARVLGRPNNVIKEGRIIGGNNVAIEDVPYQVSMQVSGFGFCGAAIISADWVLTAAHCTQRYPADVMRIRAGSSLLSEGGSLHVVQKIIQHEKYGVWHGMPVHDIALVNLANPLKFDAARQSIPMYRQNEEAVEGRFAVLSGWGAVVEGGISPEVLQSVQVPIVSKEACNEAHGGFGGIPIGQICAGDPQGGKDACQGDSGGPVAIDGRIAGIVSWGSGCGVKGLPGVYTEVAFYRDWIASKTGI